MTIKNKEGLEKYLKRFKKYSNTGLILRMKQDCFVAWVFGGTTAYVKYSTLSYKDVFNEAEIDIEGDILVSIKEIQSILDYLSKFSEGSTFKVDYDVLTDKDLIKRINQKAETQLYTEMNIASQVHFIGKTLKTKQKTISITQGVHNFRMYDKKWEGLTTEDEELTITKIPVSKAEFTTIFGAMGLEKNDSESHIEVKIGKNAVVKGVNFEFILEGYKDTGITPMNLQINRNMFGYVDIEDSELLIKYHTPPMDDDPLILLIVKSMESETYSMVVTGDSISESAE